jgi:DNA-binding IclR family transcriptional regulator
MPLNGKQLWSPPHRGGTGDPTVTGGAGGAAEPARVRGRRPPQGDPVVDRAFALLAAFDSGHRSLTLGELSRRSGIPTSSTLRLAGRLQAWGALERGTDGRFTIGLRLWEVASLAPRGQGLKQVALPFMGDLEEVTRQHVLLAVRDGEDALLVERLSAHQAMPVLYRVGGRLPLHSTGVGLVLLAFAESGFQEHMLAQPLMHQPENVAVSPAALRRTLAEARRDGLVTLRRRAPQPLVSVAAPIFGAEDKAVAALSVVVPRENAEPRLLGPAVRTAARSISRGLGARRSIGATTSAV